MEIAVAPCVRALLAALIGALGVLSPAPSYAADEPEPPPLGSPLEVTPLAHLRVTGGYGELRANHVHAGLDFSTDGHVGEPVRAPLPGFVERVRASGVGYGRSLYLRARDGRLLVFGHLDAFAPRVAAYVDSVQRASGQYEQDLSPSPGRFRFGAGETIAWTGRSGSVDPHLHFEIRHDDFALDPLRAGIVVPADGPPRIEALTLEPLDPDSRVEGSAGPVTRLLGARAETLSVRGRVRLVVRARAGFAGVAGNPAWSIAAEWEGRRIESRLDSLSWAGEMSELDEVFDRGRIADSRGSILWHPAGFTPRFLMAGGGAWDGTIALEPGAPARPLRLIARDAGGLSSERTVWLRGARTDERADRTLPPGAHAGLAPSWTFASLPEGAVRIELRGVPAAVREVRIGSPAGPLAPATCDGRAWSVVLAASPLPSGAGFEADGVGARNGPWSARCDALLWPAGADRRLRPAEGVWLAVPPEAVDEGGVLATLIDAPPQAADLVAIGPAIDVQPHRYPLRRPAPIAFAVPKGADPRRLDVYRLGDDGTWSPLRARADSSGALAAETTDLGVFALMRDDVPPRVERALAPRHVPIAPYPRWALTARVIEAGSGVDPGASAFEVDGRREPTEWDGVRRVLRWRPLVPPARGVHAWRVVVVDRAGNATRRSGVFVIA
ncbi:MAG TPA: M23 family metallopeptidase [Candidatus Acidoferrales bacterium]|nr:M23 family metallopeptidase [Candidatus Acidoferrales bacterium]